MNVDINPIATHGPDNVMTTEGNDQHPLNS